MNKQEILDQSPDIPGYGGGKWAMYSVHCCWWTSFPEDLGNTAEFMPGKLKIHSIGGRRDVEVDFDGLPCCPHCGSVLMQAPLERFVEYAESQPEHYGRLGMQIFFASHHRNSPRCFTRWEDYEPLVEQDKP